MKMVVLIKQVPDTYGERSLDPTTGWIERDSSDRVADEINERALEVALKYKDDDKSTEVVALTMGPPPAKDALRKALSMGADTAVHILDDTLAGADVLTTARMLAEALRREQPDVVLAGNESTDGRGGVVPAAIAEYLGLPLLSALDSLSILNGQVSGVRRSEFFRDTLHADLPAIVSITESTPEARFPNFKGLMTAKRKKVKDISADDLLSPSAPVTAHSTVLTVARRAPRSAGVKLVDDGQAATRLADFLIGEHLI